MKIKLIRIILAGLFFQIVCSCSVNWTEAIQYGEITQTRFTETINIEIEEGLIFLPVIIHGKEYRFLFDSGAPFSISSQLQNELAFKVVSKGKIIDSDHNRKKVIWAQIDSINIGDIAFLKQTAFVGDFEANPLLRCLRIDGIIGSNILRQCNWTIDQQQNSLTFSTEEPDLEGQFSIPFKTDYQYNMFINIDIGQAVVKNILVDYGSNGSISLNKEIFSTLKNRNIIGESWVEKGMQQSGIIGKTVDLKREIVYSDSVYISNMELKQVMVRTGKTVSVGNNLLSRFRITIDWKNRNLHLIPNGNTPGSIHFPGFKLSYSPNQGIYVQSVIEQSKAYQEGVRPNMKVIKLDGLNFEGVNDFCDYVNHEFDHLIFMELIDSTGHKTEYQFEQTSY